MKLLLDKLFPRREEPMGRNQAMRLMLAKSIKDQQRQEDRLRIESLRAKTEQEMGGIGRQICG